MKTLPSLLVVGIMSVLVSVASRASGAEHLSLDGPWRLAMTGPEPTFPAATLPNIKFADTIILPATTATAGKGPVNADRSAGGLTTVHWFVGPAWYQREVEFPAAWTGQRVELRIERTRYTQVWLDGRALGESGLYTASQRYNLTAVATAGKHQLTIMVDNRPERRPVRAQAHQYDDGTQSNWNGLLGKIEIVALPRLWLEDVQVFPDLRKGAFHVRIQPGKIGGAAVAGTVRVEAESFNQAGPTDRPAEVSASLRADGATEIELPLGVGAQRWDEFSPALYRLTVRLESSAGVDERVIETGLREFRTRDRQFTINGRPTFLRGKHDACVFPLLGHPPMKTDDWLRYLGIVKEWGFNHVRCHTWVPPEAAFAAADRLGIYLQIELPFWGSFDANVRDFLMPQAEAALREFGNHPSFVMMTLANEAGGDHAIMNAMVERLRAIDGRHLYADGSNNFLWSPEFQPTNDFMTSAKVKPPAHPEKTIAARGSFCVFDGNAGHTQWGPSETRTDLSAALEGLPVPFVGHETGEWTVYPDYSEIPKYTGITRAYNMERFRASLSRHGMLDQAADFQRASGALAAELYREENELFLRTPGVAGFQQLDLLDNQEQGTALVGLLNALAEPKGIVTAEEFRRSCAPVVLLARFDRYTWFDSEEYVADLQIAHYGPADLTEAVTHWTLRAENGTVIASGEIPAQTIAQGGLRKLGRVNASLRRAAAPTRCDLEVSVTAGKQKIGQRWPVWVYPSRLDTSVPKNVVLVRTFDAAAKAQLAEGRRVLLIPDRAAWANTLPGGYATDYWNWPMFNNTPGTMGMLIKAQHPALADFPTKFHSERQWAEIAHASTPVILLGGPDGYRPIVQVIDNYERNERLGLVFEWKVGSGRLLVCAADLLGEKLRDAPAAKQLLASLLRYAASDAFSPTVQIAADSLDASLRPSLAQGGTATASSSFKPSWGFIPEPRHAFDGDINTCWFPAADDTTPWIAVDLGARRAISSIQIVWETDEAGYAGTIEVSSDGTTWSELPQGRLALSTSGRVTVETPGIQARAVRLKVTEAPSYRRRAVRDIRVLGE